VADQATRDALIAAAAGGDQNLRDQLLVDVHAWLEQIVPQIAAIEASGGGQCVFSNPGASFNATADITIDPAP